MNRHRFLGVDYVPVADGDALQPQTKTTQCQHLVETHHGTSPGEAPLMCQST